MTRGYILAAFAGIAWGTIPLAVKQIYALGAATPFEISFYRFIIAFVLVAVICLKKGEPPFLLNRWSVLMGFWGVFWMSCISFAGIKLTSAVNATILFNSNPLVVVVLVLLFKWEKFHFTTLIGVLLGIGGVLIVSGVTLNLHLLGDTLVLLGAFGWAVYTVLSYKLRSFSSLSVTCSSLFWGLLCYGLLIWRTVPLMNLQSFWWVAYIGIIPTGAAFLAYVKAVEVIGSTRASVFQYLAPAVAVIISAGLGLEPITIFQIGGILCIIGGIELTRRTQDRG
ncbi:MAG: DMT family transporter [Theionarchaea archaeon]|nr:DMT family transporter [Theionarchaea archaeon]